MRSLRDVAKRFFYIFLDISGILLGCFLVVLGAWISTGRAVGRGIGFVVLFLGVSAFAIHFGHFFEIGFFKAFSGDRYFVTKRK